MKTKDIIINFYWPSKMNSVRHVFSSENKIDNYFKHVLYLLWVAISNVRMKQLPFYSITWLDTQTDQCTLKVSFLSYLDKSMIFSKFLHISGRSMVLSITLTINYPTSQGMFFCTNCVILQHEVKWFSKKWHKFLTKWNKTVKSVMQ